MLSGKASNTSANRSLTIPGSSSSNPASTLRPLSTRPRSIDCSPCMMAIVRARKARRSLRRSRKPATIDKPSHIHTGTPVQRAKRTVV
jgi:hypothetical protein